MRLLSGFDRQRGLKNDVTFGEAFPYDRLVRLEFYGIRTFRLEDEDEYEYEFSVLSKRTSKNVGL